MATKAAQYVTIIDRSNKVIKQSGQFKGLFNEAKSAYVTRKAEIKASKKEKEEVELQKAIRSCTLEEQSVRGGSPRPQQITRRTSEYDGGRPRAERGRSSGSQHVSGSNTPTGNGQPRNISLGEFNDQLNSQYYAPQQNRSPASPVYRDPYSDPYSDPYPPQQLTRARTDLDLTTQNRPPFPVRSSSYDDFEADPHLAYGDYHAEDLRDLALQPATPEIQNKQELSSLVLKCKMLLEEADCAGHSAKAMIGHLQKNPDTLAAVGLTLAEISKVAGRLAPGALATIGKGAPAVMALLLSPEFLIAVGVAAGVTVIAIGGYKIVKRIKAKAAEKEDMKAEEAIDLREVDRVERWRRGVDPTMYAGDDGASVVSGTSVEGELMTPYAARSMGHLPPQSTTSTKDRSRKSKGDKESRSRAEGGERRKHRRRKSDEDSVAPSEGSSRLRRTSSADDRTKALVKVKKPSPLVRMFTTRD